MFGGDNVRTKIRIRQISMFSTSMRSRTINEKESYDLAEIGD